MFIDKVEIEISSGKGGDGAVSFRREKYVLNGGPDGGDGGSGGSVVFEADASLNNLGIFRFRRIFAAEAGGGGLAGNSSGKDAKDLVVKLPVGTVVFDKATGKILCDLTQPAQRYTAAQGGRGGRGNQHFSTSTRQAPRFAKPGGEGICKNVILELKTIADVGLVGFPNVGKSTLLSAVSNARPKIANYHFTTLSPNLGVVRYKDAPEFVMADIPGLIEGAAAGAGLGHDFLRHIERTRLLVHVIDASGSENRDPKADFEQIQEELFTYAAELKNAPQIIALNKMDLMRETDARELKKYFEQAGYEVYLLSAAARRGTEALCDAIVRNLALIPVRASFLSEQEKSAAACEIEIPFTIELKDGVYYVTGAMIGRLLKTVNLTDYESSSYFQRVLKNNGVFSALEKHGVKDGDTVDFEGVEFEYYK